MASKGSYKEVLSCLSASILTPRNDLSPTIDNQGIYVTIKTCEAIILENLALRFFLIFSNNISLSICLNDHNYLI